MDNSQENLDLLAKRVETLEELVRDQTRRIAELEGRRVAPKVSPSAPATPKVSPVAPAPPVLSVTENREIESYQIEPVEQRPRYLDFISDFESRIGGSWLNRIGILALIFGMGFFLKHAFESEWLGPRGRVLIGLASGLILLLGGERFRKKGFRHYSHGLSGGGIALLYLSIYAGVVYYNVITHTIGFLMMFSVTILAVILSAFYNALAIAVLGLIGGFLTPVLLSRGADNQIGLFSYILLLDTGVLIVAIYRQWRSLDLLAFAGTVLIFLGWMDRWYVPDKLALTIIFATLFFLLFATISVFHNLYKLKESEPTDLILIVLNNFFYFTACYSLLDLGYHHLLGLFTITLSGFNGLLAHFTIRRLRDSYLAYTYIGIATLLLTIAIPIQLDEHWVTLAWGLEATILTWIGVRIPESNFIKAAPFVFLIALVHWIAFDLPVNYDQTISFTPILNSHFFSGFTVVAGLAISYFLLKRRQFPDADMLAQLYQLSAALLFVTLLSIDVNYYYKPQEELRVTPYSPRQVALTFLWILYGSSTLIIGIIKELPFLRLAASIVLIIATTSVLSMNAVSVSVPGQGLLNLRLMISLMLIAGLALIAKAYYEQKSSEEEAVTIPVILILCNFLLVVTLSVQVYSMFLPGTGSMAPTVALSVLWTIYGGVMLMLGLQLKNQLLRIMALILLGLAITKVFLFDLSSLNHMARIISFLVLGLVLLVLSFLYQQNRKRVADETGDVTS